MAKIDQNKYDGLENERAGRAFEQRVSTYFGSRGWPVESRKIFESCGEFDIYAKVPNTFSPDQYLLVECKCTTRVSSGDITRFQDKVRIFCNRHTNAKVQPFFCYTGEIDQGAKRVAAEHDPPMKFIPFKPGG